MLKIFAILGIGLSFGFMDMKVPHTSSSSFYFAYMEGYEQNNTLAEQEAETLRLARALNEARKLPSLIMVCPPAIKAKTKERVACVTPDVLANSFQQMIFRTPWFAIQPKKQALLKANSKWLISKLQKYKGVVAWIHFQLGDPSKAYDTLYESFGKVYHRGMALKKPTKESRHTVVKEARTWATSAKKVVYIIKGFAPDKLPEIEKKNEILQAHLKAIINR